MTIHLTPISWNAPRAAIPNIDKGVIMRSFICFLVILSGVNGQDTLFHGSGSKHLDTIHGDSDSLLVIQGAELRSDSVMSPTDIEMFSKGLMMLGSMKNLPATSATPPRSPFEQRHTQRLTRYVIYTHAPEKMTKFALSRRKGARHVKKITSVKNGRLFYKKWQNSPDAESLALGEVKAIGRYDHHLIGPVVSVGCTGYMLGLSAIWWVIALSAEEDYGEYDNAKTVTILTIPTAYATIKWSHIINAPSPGEILILTGSDEEKYRQILDFIDQ